MNTSHPYFCLKLPRNFRALAIALLTAVLPFASLSAATYEYDAGAASFPGTLWSDKDNWVGDTVPTFNNQADLIFNTNIQVSGMRIGSARTVRSMFFGDNLTGGANPATAIIVQTIDNGGGATPALTLQADTGNATVTQTSGFQGDVLRLGTFGGGSLVLASSLDLFAHSATKPVQFDTGVTGAGALNKYGVGIAEIYRGNSFTGGINIFEGTIDVYNNALAVGTGAMVLGGSGSSTNAALRVGNTINITNAMTVSSGSGTRTISNLAGQAGNATLSGPITLNTNATFAITLVTGGTHDRITVTGALGGVGGVIKTGTGILVLTASNTYSGTTDIQGGKFFLGGAGRLGSGAVTISNGANIDFATGAGQTNFVDNNISGGGLILQNVAGTRTVLRGEVTSTGGMTLNAGTMIIGEGATGSYTGNAVVNTGAVLAFGRSNAYTHGGTISGLGGVTKVGLGAATLTATNTYSGVTSLFEGALVAGNADALGTGNIVFRPEGGNNGTLRYTAASATTDWASRFKNSGGTIRLDTAGNNVTLAGVIDSSNTNGLVKSGTGTLTLGGANTYGGNTTVAAGTLSIPGSGSLVFSIGGAGTNNALLGPGALSVDGQFIFDLANASTNTGDSWTIVAASLNESYGSNFLVSGFNGSGGTWTLATNGVIYQFEQSTGVLSIPGATPADDYANWLTNYPSLTGTNALPTADPDGDGLANEVEFAFGGDPTVGTPALMTARLAGTNAVFNWIERTNGVNYEVQTSGLLTNGWIAASVTISNSTNQSGVLLAPEYVRREFVVPAAGRNFYRVLADTTGD
jgi:autotransporter-associated beta strand protein